MTEDKKKEKCDLFLAVSYHTVKTYGWKQNYKHIASLQDIADELSPEVGASINKDMVIISAAQCFKRLLREGPDPYFCELENCYLEESFAEKVKQELLRVNKWAECLARGTFEGYRDI